MHSIIRAAFLAGLLAVSSSANERFSDIFAYDPSPVAPGPGKIKLTMAPVRVGDFGSVALAYADEDDLPFMEAHFADPQVMRFFADGQARPREQTRTRFVNISFVRTLAGQPHGIMAVSAVSNIMHGRIGHFVAGIGDRPGIAEIAYSYDPAVHGRGIGKAVIGKIFSTWAPEVARIGNGIGMRPDQAAVVTAFRCYKNAPLQGFDATVSPANIASLKILSSVGFEAAQYAIAGDLNVETSGLRLPDSPESAVEFERYLLERFYAADSYVPASFGKRYRVSLCDNTFITMSCKSGGIFKYHLECYPFNSGL